MKVFTYSAARQNLARLLQLAQREEVRIQRRDGTVFVLRMLEPQDAERSPFDVPGVKTQATTRDIVEALRASRAR